MAFLNCEMEFACPNSWDSLRIQSIDNPNIRDCDACNKEVHFCHTYSELNRAIAKGFCVAFVSESQVDIDNQLMTTANRMRLTEQITGIPRRNILPFKYDESDKGE